jgi:hypothetical protein
MSQGVMASGWRSHHAFRKETFFFSEEKEARRLLSIFGASAPGTRGSNVQKFLVFQKRTFFPAFA